MVFSRTSVVAAGLALLPLIHAQNPDSSNPGNLDLTTYKCTTSGGCVAQDTQVVLDWNYRWIHTSSSTSCTTGSGVDSSLCPDEATCAENCEIAAANYTSSGVSTSGDKLTMYQYVESNGAYNNASPRLYLLGSDGNYVMLKLNGGELSFDVDLSTLPCGENGALYLSQMDATGGRNEYNTGGAQYGSGYCDAQCPVQTWKNGTLNTNGSGYCCVEMDILEGNSQANAYTTHPCSGSSCDSGGCGFNPYAQGATGFYGPGKTVDTSKPFTITTQFVTDDGTPTGTLTEIRRQYIQNGVVIPNAASSSGANSLTASGCSSSYGGMTTMGQSLSAGMVLIFSIWNDNSQNMNWLDSGSAGPCSSSEGAPSNIQANDPTTHVIFSNIRWGDIGSTTASVPPSQPAPSSPVTSTPPTVTPPTGTGTGTGPTQSHWGQCGGIGYSGPTTCESGTTCQEQNAYYSQCL